MQDTQPSGQAIVPEAADGQSDDRFVATAFAGREMGEQAMD
jgi:hypothetical protein